jgi:hypothetical protein
MAFYAFPLLIEKTFSKIARPFLFRHVSRKRISQLSFQKLTETLAREFGQKSIKYVVSSELSTFLREHLEQLPRVIVSGGSDWDLREDEYELVQSLDHTIFYIQNLNFPEVRNVKLLPIGVEDMRWARNGMSWNFRKSHIDRSKVRRVLVGPFGATHMERVECAAAARSISVCDLFVQRISNWGYSHLASSYVFVACPRGNGLDTHRFWETIYRGSIPVVIDSQWSETLVSYGLGLVTVSTWENLGEVLEFPISTQPTDSYFVCPKWWQERFRADLQFVQASIS